MAETDSDPWEIASMGELLEIARHMEQEAIDGYQSLAKRMHEAGRADLASVFEALILEERGHLSNVDEWQNSLGRRENTVPVRERDQLFDDEGAGVVAPGLLSAYRAFSTAVRNEERAFVFWTYVAAHAQSNEIGSAAERMAREELGHAAKLRSERRRAFHLERSTAERAASADLPLIEKRLASQFADLSNLLGFKHAERSENLADDAFRRAASLTKTPFLSKLSLAKLPDSAGDRPIALCEFLADCYLDLGENAASEHERERAQQFAAEMVHCLKIVRDWHAAGSAQ
jgi:rubrerythrin